jgi:crooked neck
MERARQIFEIAINQEELDMPEGVWKAYIDFEIENAQNGPKPFDFSKVRGLYDRLLDITQHVKVWISYAQFDQK